MSAWSHHGLASRCRYTALALSAALITACAGATDHFYALSPLPDAPRPATNGFSSQVILRVSIPSMVDRRQMIVDTSGDRILVLEHERWVSGPSDLVSQTLASDIEQRRPDVLVAGQGFNRPDVKPVQIRIDIVRMSAHRGGQATLEAHWRIVDPQTNADTVGGETFTAPIGSDDYAAIARAYSTCLAALADRLVASLAPH